MNISKYKIKDNCRKNLSKYTIKAFSSIPKINNPLILDIGCGTGVTTLAIMEICNGFFYAVDSDESCLNWLKEKVTSLKYANRIKIIKASILDLDLFNVYFDIILAEGLLNVIDFEKGMSVLLRYLKNSRYLVLHDELINVPEKREIFKKNNLKLINSFELNEDVWWNEYYSCLEKSIEYFNNDSIFKSEINEIFQFKKDPTLFKSIYHVLHYL
jgi:ubiquinone/menaquinone biosynthesis C-methylase UbiE